MNLALPIIVINLDRAPNRLIAVLEQFDRAQLSKNIKRFSAMDAMSPNFFAPGYAPGTWRDSWALSTSAQACFFSHREVWKSVAEGTATGAVICEDDIMISKNLGAVLQTLEIERYGVIKLDGFSAYRRYGAKMKMGDYVVREIVSLVPSSACYAISKAAARRLLEDSSKFCTPLDNFVFAARKDLHPVQLFPGIAVQGMCRVDDKLVPEAIRASGRNVDDMIVPRVEQGPFLYILHKKLKRAGLKLARAVVTDRQLIRHGGGKFRPHLANDLPQYKD